jgi:hypothetical protein
MTRRLLPVALAVLAVASLALSTGGFSATIADRGVSVAVVDDDQAYLGVDLETTDASNGTANLSVTVANRFPADTTLTAVEVEAGGETRTPLAGGATVTTGDATTVRFANVSCGSTVSVTASGDGVAVTLSRPVECT